MGDGRDACFVITTDITIVNRYKELTGDARSYREQRPVTVMKTVKRAAQDNCGVLVLVRRFPHLRSRVT